MECPQRRMAAGWPQSRPAACGEKAQTEHGRPRRLRPGSHADRRAALPVGFYASMVSAVRSPRATLSGSGVSLKCVCE